MGFKFFEWGYIDNNSNSLLNQAYIKEIITQNLIGTYIKYSEAKQKIVKQILALIDCLRNHTKKSK